MSKRNIQRAARRIQSECGLKYTTAFQWVRENHDGIIAMILVNDKPDWREYAAAAAGLWRRNES